MGPRAARALERWRLLPALAAVAGALALAAPSGAALPDPGLLVPGQSLGGLRLGMTKAQVRTLWGASFGRCRSCAQETWYFNYRPFTPQGAGVSFSRGRVARIFTVWQPLGWRTTRGVSLGAPLVQVTHEYPRLVRRACRGYTAFVLRGRRGQTVFYIHKDALWGLGLTRRGWSPCV